MWKRFPPKGDTRPRPTSFVHGALLLAIGSMVRNRFYPIRSAKALVNLREADCASGEVRRLVAWKGREELGVLRTDRRKTSSLESEIGIELGLEL